MIGNNAWGLTHIAVAALTPSVLLLAICAAVDFVEFSQIQGRTQAALEAAARGALVAYGDGVARSEAEARDAARQIFRSAAPSAATDDSEALSVSVSPRVSVARYDGALATPLRAFFRRGAARVKLTAIAEPSGKDRIVGVAAPAEADRL